MPAVLTANVNLTGARLQVLLIAHFGNCLDDRCTLKTEYGWWYSILNIREVRMHG
nr:MAG TPA: hypothetical protein [Caudoviricetes sp.]